MINYHAKYTVVLNELLNDSEVRPLIDRALSTYPIYKSKSKEENIPDIIPTREEINSKLLDYYKFREIGFETIGRFIEELRIAMEEIMPYYNQLMFTQAQDYNIIYNVDYVRNTDTKRDGEHESSMQGTANGSIKDTGSASAQTQSSDESETSTDMANNSKHVKSDTPQDELSITAKNIDSVNYANEVNWNKDGSESVSTSSGNATTSTESETEQNRTTTDTSNMDSSGTNSETEQIVETIKGNYGQVSAQRLIMTYRETILNIEQMIINDRRIQELFMLVW